MKTQTLATAAAVLALAVAVGAAATQPTQAQGQGPGRWQAAGSYPTDAGGEVWMINTTTGAARNCFWQRPYEGAPPELRCRQVDN